MNDRIYMDYAATTPVLPEAAKAMIPYLTELYGNPSGAYGTAREARKGIEQARKTIAQTIHAEPNEIYFTSGGSESDNIAIKGTAFALKGKGKHLITSMIEHHAVINSCKWLEKQGFQITYLPVDSYGLVSPEELKKAICPETILISIMAANNEIGTIEPICEIGKIAKSAGVLFHTDAVQAFGSIPIYAEECQADLISISAHKCYGPKGTGALYIRKGTQLDPVIHGGHQERGIRAGTENTAGIVGMGKAVEIASREMKEYSERMIRLRDLLISLVLNEIPESRLNGHPTERLPNHAHFSFRGTESEALLLRLDLAGVAVSGGSACTSGSLEKSYVLKAIGADEGSSYGSVRMTLGRNTTEEEIRTTASLTKEIVADLRSMQT